MANVLESSFLWRGFSWLCFMALVLWLITLLFPRATSSHEHSPEALSEHPAEQQADLKNSP